MTPDFVQYGSLMVPPAPFDSLGAKVTGFIVKADGAKLDALCQRVFKDTTGGEIDVLAIGDRVMLTWGTIDSVVCMTGPYKGVGGVAEPQVVVWIPVAHVAREDDGTPVAERFAVFVPYIWVDNAMSLATGRELFGYPKAWGYITFPAAGEATRTWGCDVFGLDFGKGETVGRRPLLEIIEGDALEGDGDDPGYDGILDLAKDVVGRLLHRGDDEMHVSMKLAEDLWGDLRGKSFPHLFLKQIRAIEDEGGAALQQVGQASYSVGRAHAKPLLREFTLNVRPLDSHPVVAELGLESQSFNLAYEIDMDFVVGGGRVLWDSATR
jgi:hypothetical protein